MLVEDGEGALFGGEVSPVAAEEGISAEHGGWGGAGRRSALGSAHGEGERGGAVGVTVRCRVRAIENVAGVGDGAVDGVEIFADVARNWDEEFAIFERGSQAWKKFGLE